MGGFSLALTKFVEKLGARYIVGSAVRSDFEETQNQLLTSKMSGHVEVAAHTTRWAEVQEL